MSLENDIGQFCDEWELTSHQGLQFGIQILQEAKAELATLCQQVETAERRAYEFEGRYEECRVGWVKEQDRTNKLAEQLEAAEKDAQKWKQMAEFQYAVRQYPHDLNLGQGALDAYFKGWSFDAAIAAGRKS